MTLETKRIYLDLGPPMRNVGILKELINGGELTRNISQKKKSVILQAYGGTLCGTFCWRDYLFNKHVEYSESVR